MRNSILTYLLASLNLLLLFLATFSSNLHLPTFLQWSGKLHPMLLHFPLALILVTVALQFFRLPPSTLHLLTFLSAITATTSALLGLFLSTSGEYDNGLLQKHLWLGVSISVLAFLFWLFRNTVFWKRLCMILIVPVLVLGSHYGASITHGENYLDWPVSNAATQQPNITDSTAVYAALVEPILASKCYSCHNEKKAKGELIMTSIAALMKGGKNGPLWKPGDPLNSHLLQRAQLSEDDKKHMPPRGKPQLAAQELKILELWIATGADMKKRFMDYAAEDSAGQGFAAYIPKKAEAKSYPFEAADPAKIKAANSAYCDIRPLAIGTSALAVRFNIRTAFSPDALQRLEPIGTQIVSLNLTGMPVTDKDLEGLNKFPNLEILHLNNTSISGKGLATLATLKQLERLSLNGTALEKTTVQALSKSASLQQVFIWNTGIQPADTAALRRLNPSIHWDLGMRSDSTEFVRLTPPQFLDLQSTILNKGDTLALKHPMPGVQIRYTIDGSKPDSLSSVRYTKPIVIDSAFRLRAITTRAGWLTSDTIDKTIFLRSAKPDFAKLLSKPDSNYALKGIESLVDQKKGDMNNIREDWMGFHGVTCEAVFRFNRPVQFRELVVSTLKKTGPHILPPDHLELWAGADSLHLKKIATIVPVQPKQYEADKIEVQKLKIDGTYQYFKLRVVPVKALPRWHDSKGKKVWIFIDEIFFN
jgi:hypothetical protein